MRRVEVFKWCALAVIGVAGLYNYRDMFSFTAVMFNAPIEDMSHGWVVPFVSAYIVWSQRARLRQAAGQPSWVGAMWVLPCLALAWFGGRGGQSRLEQVSLIGLIWALPYAFWGSGAARVMRFPAAYLLFTVPVSSFLDFFTIHLRLLSTWLATGLLNGVGIAVERTGTALFSHMPGGEFNVDVAAPCSGIRSIFALMALMAVYAFFTQRALWKKWVLFALSVPIAVVGNMARIISICLVATWFGQEAATGYYHDYSAYVVFIVGVLLMVRAGDFLKRRWHGTAVEPPADRPDRLRAPGATRAHGIVACVTVLTLAVFGLRLMTPSAAYDSTTFVAQELPERVGEFGSDIPWFCHNPQCLEMALESKLARGVGEDARQDVKFVCPSCGNLMHTVSLGERTDLPADTVILKRNYRTADGLVYSVSLVVGGRQRNSIHRAELCLPAQGFTMLGAKRRRFKLGADQSVAMRQVEAQRAGGARFNLLYYFVSRKRTCDTHTERILLDVWDRSIHNRINRWAMVALGVSSGLETPESVERLEAFLAEFLPRVVFTEQ